MQTLVTVIINCFVLVPVFIYFGFVIYLYLVSITRLRDPIDMAAHKVDEERTDDVVLDTNYTFENM